jgi:hypothetical protein
MMEDPVTGDKLTSLEYYVRQVQVAVRTPWFIFVFNAITLACILLNLVFQWNAFASWLAIMIEWLVGCYMFGQTGRDALIIRAIRKEITEKVERMEEAHGKMLQEIKEAVTVKVTVNWKDTSDERS